MTSKKPSGLLAIAMGAPKKDSAAEEMAEGPSDGQKAAADKLAALLGVDDPDALASALKDFVDNC